MENRHPTALESWKGQGSSASHVQERSDPGHKMPHQSRDRIHSPSPGSRLGCTVKDRAVDKLVCQKTTTRSSGKKASPKKPLEEERIKKRLRKGGGYRESRMTLHQEIGQPRCLGGATGITQRGGFVC